MIKKSLVYSSLIGGSLLFTGCATILDGDTQSVMLNSKKPQTVQINGQEFSAPGVINLQRSDKDAIITVKECNKQVLLKKEVNPTFFVNILSGGAFGSTTDYASKSMWKYDQANVTVDCE